MTLGADYSPAAGRAHFLGVWRLMADLGSTSGPALISGATALFSLAAGIVCTGLLALAAGAVLWYWIPRTAKRPASADAAELARLSLRNSALRRAPGLVARLGRGVRRIEPGQRHAGLDLAHDPALEPLLLERARQHLVEQRRRDDDRAVAVGDDDVVRQ